MQKRNTMEEASYFDGRPCPPEFAERLKSLRERGILDDPKFLEAFERVAKRVSEDMRPEWTGEEDEK